MPLAAEGHIFGGCEFIRYDDRPSQIGRAHV